MSDLSTPQAVMTRPLCGCGCGRPVNFARHDDRANGYVKGQPGCWIWQRGKLSCGYGLVHRRGRRWLAHRWYFVSAGREIPDGLQLDHLCRNRSCVNPDHLEPVTSAENTRRGVHVKLTAFDAAAIRQSQEDALVLARRYGIARSTVYNIRGGWTWTAV